MVSLDQVTTTTATWYRENYTSINSQPVLLGSSAPLKPGCDVTSKQKTQVRNGPNDNGANCTLAEPSKICTPNGTKTQTMSSI